MQKLPDSMVVHGKAMVREHWAMVVSEYSKKSVYAQVDMWAKFMALHCLEKSNPRDLLEGLHVKKEELAQAGVDIDQRDYLSVVISSLPYGLSNFVSSQLVAAQFGSSKLMMPDNLLSMLMEESELLTAACTLATFCEGIRQGKGGW
jgi:hypothetical protein